MLHVLNLFFFLNKAENINMNCEKTKLNSTIVFIIFVVFFVIIANLVIMMDYQKTLELFNGNNATKKFEILLKSKKGFQSDEENGLQQKRSTSDISNISKIINKKNEKIPKYTKKLFGRSLNKFCQKFDWMKDNFLKRFGWKKYWLCKSQSVH